MKPKIVFRSFLFIAFFFGVIAFAPIPDNPFSFNRFWKKTGMEKQEDYRRNIIEQRKKKATRILREQMEAIERDRETLMENRKDSMGDSKRLLEQTIDSRYLREIGQQKADKVKQQTEDLLKKQQDAQIQAQAERDPQAQRLQEQRDRMNDLRDFSP